MNDPLNLTQTRVLLAHRNNAAAKLFESMLRGFGIHNIHTARSAKDLAENFSAGHIDMAIIDNSVGRKEIPGILSHVRRGRTSTSRDIPIVLSYCHSSYGDVLKFRDSGANMIMSAPISVNSVYNRLDWIARKPRPFVVADKYCGPCRRVTGKTESTGLARRHSDPKPRLHKKPAAEVEDLEFV
jgi:CheY-like chemotaxis protein